jgi:hypothetical protein
MKYEIVKKVSTVNRKYQKKEGRKIKRMSLLVWQNAGIRKLI